MARIVRKDQAIFALGASNNGQFGSAQSGDFVTSDDLAVLQALPAWNNGWSDAVLSGEKLPTLEEFQGLNYVNTYQTAYLFQEGIPEYSAGTTYFIHSIVKKPATYELYGSLTDNNIGNALTDGTKWQRLSDLSDMRQVYNGAVTTGSANAQATATTNGDFTKTYGYIVTFGAGFSNTGAATLNVDGTGATTIKKNGVSGLVDVVLGDIIVGESYQVEYNGTYFVLIDPTLPAFGTMASQNSNAVAITGGTIDGTAIGGTTAGAGKFTTAIANSFIPNSNTVPTNGLYLPAANTIGWAINSSAKLQLTSAAFAPAASGGNDLGTIALMWGNLFLQSGGVINWNNGNATLTHSAGILTSNVPLALGANGLTMTGSLAATGARVIKGWFTDIESTNAATIGGIAASGTGGYALTHSPAFTTPNIGVATATSLQFSNTATGGIIGTITNDDAAAGYVGEYIESDIVFGSAISVPSSASPINITSISLSEGDWTVWGSIATAPAATTTTQAIGGCISTTSITFPVQATNKGGLVFAQTVVGAGNYSAYPVGTTRIKVPTGSPLTVYLVARITFAISTMSAYGFIAARRAR